MKKFISLMAVVVLLILNMSVCLAANDGNVSMTADATDVKPGDTVTITVNIKGDSDESIHFFGGLLRLTYDPSRMTFVEEESTYGTFGEIFTGFKKFTEASDVGILNVQNYPHPISDTEIPAGDGTFATIKFKINDDAPAGKITLDTVANTNFYFTKSIKSEYEIDKINTIDLNVSGKTSKISGVKITNKFDTMFMKHSYQLKAETTPAGAENQLIWEVSDDTVAAVNHSMGIVFPKNPGNVTVTVSSPTDPSIKDSFDVVIKPAQVNKAASATVSVYDTLYANSLSWDGDKTFRINISLFAENGMYLPKSVWTDYYGIVYEDNFEGLKGIIREGNTIVVSKDAQDAENLVIKANVISKVTGETACIVETQPFKVVSAIKVSDVKFDGAEATENADGTYTLKLTGDSLKADITASRTPYVSYSINGGAIVKGDVNIAKSDLKPGKNKLVIYIHGDNRSGAAGYKLSSLAKTIVAEIEN